MMQKQKIAIYVFLFLALEIFLIAFVDRPLALYMQDIGREYPQWLSAVHSFTDLGLSKWYLWPSGIGCILCGIALRLPITDKTLRTKIAYFGYGLFIFFAALALTGIALDIVKWVIGRSRPPLFLQDGIYTLHPFASGFQWKSMPSGHTETVFAIAAILIALHPNWRIPCFIFGFGMAASRIIVDIHYISDTIAGGVFGYFIAASFVAAFNHDGKFHLKESIYPIDRKTSAF